MVEPALSAPRAPAVGRGGIRLRQAVRMIPTFLAVLVLAAAFWPAVPLGGAHIAEDTKGDLHFSADLAARGSPVVQLHRSLPPGPAGPLLLEQPQGHRVDGHRPDSVRIAGGLRLRPLPFPGTQHPVPGHAEHVDAAAPDHDHSHVPALQVAWLARRTPFPVHPALVWRWRVRHLPLPSILPDHSPGV